MKLEIAITRRQKRAIVAASLVAVSLMAALWVSGDACAACNPVTIKVPAQLVGKDDTTPLALKDGEYLIGVHKTIMGPVELYVLIQQGQWAGVFSKVAGVKSQVLPDAPAPPEVEKCIASVKPTAGLVPQLRDLVIPSAEAAIGSCRRGSRCLLFMNLIHCFQNRDGTVTCYLNYYCTMRGTNDLCYRGRSAVCGTKYTDKCGAGYAVGLY